MKLVGPSRQEISVVDRTSRKVNVGRGTYRILVRYGDGPNNYRYTKGDPFDVSETDTGYEEITITLHTVAGGNYDARPSSPGEFNRGGGSMKWDDSYSLYEDLHSHLSWLRQ